MVIKFSWSWRECNFLLQLKNSSENSLETFQNNSRHSNILKTWLEANQLDTKTVESQLFA